MRIPLAAIHRAFPELDRYSDEQRTRFVRAACRTGWRRHAHRAALLLIFAVLLVVSGIGFGFATGAIVESSPAFRRDLPFATALTVGLFLGFFTPTIITIIIRDRLLLGRIRYVLRTRGRCSGCSYLLVGVPLSGADTVVCPECGMENEVDPSLSVLTTAADGDHRVIPGVIAAPRKFWTARRVRFATRAAIAAGLLLFVGFPMGWGLYESYLSRQARIATQERPGSQGLLALVERHQPRGTSPADPDAWDAFFAADALRLAIDESIAPPEQIYTSSGRTVQADFDLLAFDWRATTDPEDVELRLASESAAARALDAYRRAGLFETLGEVSRRPRAVRRLALAPGDPAILALLPELGASRQFARINAARMRLARQSGDLAEFADALESNLALARINRHQPFFIQSLVAAGIESLAIKEVRACLAAKPDTSWLDAIESAIARQSSSPPHDFHLQGERLVALDAVGWFFSEPERVRFGAFSGARALEEVFGGGGPPRRLGSYAANRDAIDAYFTAALAYDKLRPRERKTAQPIVCESLPLLEIILPSVERVSETVDQVALDRHGLAVQLALERHRIAHGAYPDSLASLNPRLPARVTDDPWSGKPLVYRRVGTGPDVSYVLYSVGYDGTDNGGINHPKDRAESLRPIDGLGYDFLLHQPPDMKPDDAAGASDVNGGS